MWRSILIWSLFLGLSLTACQTDPEVRSREGEPCSDGDQCLGNLVCQEGRCVNPLAEDGDASDGDATDRDETERDKDASDTSCLPGFRWEPILQQCILDASPDGDVTDRDTAGDADPDESPDLDETGDGDVTDRDTAGDADPDESPDLDDGSDGDGEEADVEIVDPGLTWVSIPGGTYQMGCVPQDTQCDDSEKPRHSVTVSAFEMTSTEITQGQYEAVMGTNPSRFSSCGEDCPVEQVDWNEAAAFCEAVGGRLPTEEEWEYAARAGTTTIWPYGDDARYLNGIAWYDDNSEGSTHPVAQKTANGFGLYDMIGNVWEWTSSCWTEDYNSSQDCSRRVLRGGSWANSNGGARSSKRDRRPSTFRANVGLRCVRGASTIDGDADGDGESEKDQEWEMTDPGLTWVSIPGGTYQMGCVPQDTQCGDNEKPRHSVTVSAFEMTSTEITQGQYFAVMGRNPSRFSSCGEDCPVEQVNWNEAAAFCEAVGGRLPTEEEWEYAARAGTTTIYPCGDDARCLNEIAWYDDNSEDSMHPVAQKTANGFGLYDMIGNVIEWTGSCARFDYNSSQDCSQRVFRGSSWLNSAVFGRSSSRSWVDPAGWVYIVGLRCSRDASTIDGDADGDGEEADVEIVDPGLTWVSIPGGTYQMGCVPQDTECFDFEKPQHSVTVLAFEMTSTEITQGQFFAVMGRNPSNFSSCGEDCPVEEVDWNEAAAFCEAVGGRLPMEEEWEYAARAGTTTIYPCGDDASCLNEIAWYDDNNVNSTHSVAQKSANGFGLYDMIGNVWEWTSSCWRNDYSSIQNCSRRVIRGSSWYSVAGFARSSHRSGYAPTNRDNNRGLRCVRD